MGVLLALALGAIVTLYTKIETQNVRALSEREELVKKIVAPHTEKSRAGPLVTDVYGVLPIWLAVPIPHAWPLLTR